MRFLFFGLMIFLTTSSLHAQISTKSFQQQSTTLEYSMFQAQPDVIKKPGTAVLISVGTTVATLVISPILLSSERYYTASFLTVLALYAFAPGAGYLYINNSDQFLKGGIQRGLAITAVAAGGLITVVALFDDIFEEDGKSNNLAYGLGYAIMFSGLGYYVYTTIRDFIGVHRDTKLYNAEKTMSFRVIPVVDPVSSVYGAGLQVRF